MPAACSKRRPRDWGDGFIHLYSFKAYCVPGAPGRGDRLGRGVPRGADEGARHHADLRPARRADGAGLGVEALRDWRLANRDLIRRAETFRRAAAQLPGWRLDALGAYFAYLRLPEDAPDAVAMAETLAVERGLLGLPGPFFGPGQERYLRLAFANAGGQRDRAGAGAVVRRRASPTGTASRCWTAQMISRRALLALPCLAATPALAVTTHIALRPGAPPFAVRAWVEPHAEAREALAISFTGQGAPEGRVLLPSWYGRARVLNAMTIASREVLVAAFEGNAGTGLYQELMAVIGCDDAGRLRILAIETLSFRDNQVSTAWRRTSGQFEPGPRRDALILRMRHGACWPFSSTMRRGCKRRSGFAPCCKKCRSVDWALFPIAKWVSRSAWGNAANAKESLRTGQRRDGVGIHRFIVQIQATNYVATNALGVISFLGRFDPVTRPKMADDTI